MPFRTRPGTAHLPAPGGRHRPRASRLRVLAVAVVIPLALLGCDRQQPEEEPSTMATVPTDVVPSEPQGGTGGSSEEGGLAGETPDPGSSPGPIEADAEAGLPGDD